MKGGLLAVQRASVPVRTSVVSARPRLLCQWPRAHSTPSTSPVLSQLQRVVELQRRVAIENSKQLKGRIITEYPDLRQLLEQVYDPTFRTHLSFASYRSHGVDGKASDDSSVEIPSSITELLHLLSTRQVVGHAAKNLVATFLRAHGVGPDSTEHEMFGRLLDRNLAAGFGARTLSELRWAEAPHTSTSTSTRKGSSSAPRSTDLQGPRGMPRNMKTFPVTLGKSIEPPFTDITRSTCKWYASRKLDGVRVITFVDFTMDDDGRPVFADAVFCSRTGRPFTSLDNVKDPLRHLMDWPGLYQWLARGGREVEGGARRLVLDGEICVMREKTERSGARPDDGTGAGAIWSDDNLEEDFTSTVSEIRRGPPFTIAHPVYFIFDMLDYTTFIAGKGDTTFGQRVADIRKLGDWLTGEGGKVLRPLAQWEVNDTSEIEGMVQRAAEEGWEGLVLRADKPYKGARSSDVRKFKRWLDAEYRVIGTDNSRQRLAIGGVFGEYDDAMANIWIEHKGVKVSVGSGFTAEQRVRYGKHPEDIIGKEVTVEYFSESASASREQGMSLRFPRVKQIWDEGRRTV